MKLAARLFAVACVLLVAACDTGTPEKDIKAARKADAEKRYREDRASVLADIKKLIAEQKFAPAIYHLDYLTAFQNAELDALRQQAKAGLGKANKAKADEERRKLDAVEKRGRAFLAKARKSRDDIERITWYHDPGASAIENETGVFLYIGKKDGDPKPWLRFHVNYRGDDWLFVEGFIVAADDFRYDSGKVRFKRDHYGGVVWESYDGLFRETELVVINKIVEAKKTVIRFSGSRYHKDVVVDTVQKEALRNVLAGYGAMLAGTKPE